MAPVGLFFIAGTPPYVAHVPTATTAAAFGARRSIHSLTVIGWPSNGSTPKPVQCPSPLRRSSPIAPSTTSTNGSSRSSSASYQACRNSAPFSKASTGLCRTTRGLSGMTPLSRSSRLGEVALVIATDSPSQPRPAVIQSTWIVSGSTRGAALVRALLVVRRRLVVSV